LQDESIAHMITDPPYSARVHANATQHAPKGANVMAGEDSLAKRMDLGFGCLSAAVRRTVAREAARLVTRWSMAFSDEDSMHLWRRSFEAVGLQSIRSMFWIRRGGAPQFTGDRPAVAVEAITLVHPRGRKKWNGGGKAGLYDFPIVPNRSSDPRLHTTQKPLELMLALVEDFTNPGDLILDPFAGSGTTGVAALRLGRRVILIERDAGHAQVCRERLAAEQQDISLQAARAGQISLFGGAR
jgi:site-specific DNA-methyltransferase (adenine-specific)